MTDSLTSARDRGRRATQVLVEAGRRLGYQVATEYPVQGGRLDVVWIVDVPKVFGDHPPLVAAFEIESSWRTRKHLKGDYLNLFDAGAAVGVLVLLGDGEDVDATRRFAEVLVRRPGPRILVWSEADLTQLLDEGTHNNGATPSLQHAAGAPLQHRGEEADQTARTSASRHTGNYRALWQWLSGQEADQVTVSFRDIEELIGMPLPTSSRRHAAHWHSFEGSAVARAIIDAGWKATDVSLQQERVTFRRSP